MPETTTSAHRGSFEKRITRIDAAAITEAAAQQVREQLDAIHEVSDRLDAAVKIVTECEKDLPALREERTELALSLYAYDGIRSVWASAGLSKSGFAKIRAKHFKQGVPTIDGSRKVDRESLPKIAKKAGVRHRKNALELLPRVATDVVALEARAEAAREIRNALALSLIVDGSMRQLDVAKLIGTTQARVSHLVARMEADSES